MSSRDIMLLLILILGFSLNSQAKDTYINPQNLINNYGFDSWNIEHSKCQVISKPLLSNFKKCTNQGPRKTAVGRYTQYRCQLKNKKQMLIYKSKTACAKQYHSMYIESF